jgi:Fe-S-cluster containining protein
MDLNQLPHLAKEQKKSTKKFFQKLAKQKPKNLDSTVHQLHDETFEKIDCLQCANCCKTTSPIFTDRDINRISAHFKMRPANFVEKYLHLDEDEDYVLNEAPCTFLGADNYCSIYEVAPRACREYPHTDRKQFHRILNLTVKNMAICPAVFEIVQKLKVVMNDK